GAVRNTCGTKSLASFVDSYFPKHPGFHVELQMAVVRPAAKCVRGDAIRATRAGRHIDGVLAHVKLGLVRLEIAPHAVEMNGMRHHRIVDEHDPQALAV